MVVLTALIWESADQANHKAWAAAAGAATTTVTKRSV
jgi:hypothetical protein